MNSNQPLSQLNPKSPVYSPTSFNTPNKHPYTPNMDSGYYSSTSPYLHNKSCVYSSSGSPFPHTNPFHHPKSKPNRQDIYTTPTKTKPNPNKPPSNKVNLKESFTTPVNDTQTHPATFDTTLYPPTSSSLNTLHPPKPPFSDTISSPKHDAIDVHDTLDGPANQSTNVTDDTPSDPTAITDLPLQHEATDVYNTLDGPANQPINVVHDTPDGPVKQPLAPDLQHVAIVNINGPANQPVNATSVHDTPSGPTKQSPPQHEAIDVQDPNGPKKVHHTPNGLAPLPSISPNDTSILPKDSSTSSTSSLKSKSVPDPPCPNLLQSLLQRVVRNLELSHPKSQNISRPRNSKMVISS